MKDTKTRISFEYDGTEYTLEYTAASLKKMERMGVKFGKLDETILTTPEELFSGAFIANHESVPKKKRLEIYKELAGENDDGEAIGEVIGQMLSEAIEELNSHSGKVKWSVKK